VKINEAKEIIKIVKKEPLSILIIFSLIILPVIFLEWIHFFPESRITNVVVVTVITILWIYALYRLRAELIIYRRKVILFNYLKKEKRHSIDHLSKEWAAKEEFTEKNISELLFEYPDVFKRVKVKRGEEYVDGVGLVSDSTEEEIKKL
jgi:hypothetical protein